MFQYSLLNLGVSNPLNSFSKVDFLQFQYSLLNLGVSNSVNSPLQAAYRTFQYSLLNLGVSNWRYLGALQNGEAVSVFSIESWSEQPSSKSAHSVMATCFSILY